MFRPAVIAVLAGLLVPAVQAQRGSVARPAAARAAPSARMMGPRMIPPAVGVGFRGAPGLRGNVVVRSGAGFHQGRFFHHGHRFIFTSGCFFGGFVDPFCRRAFFQTPFLAPPIFWPGIGYSSYDYGMQPYPVAETAPVPAYDDSALRVQIERLSDEIERLREEQQVRNAAPPPAAARPARADLPTILIYRDGQRSEVQNYGIVGQTLWIFNERQARKVALSEIDVSATRFANEQRGLSFVVPIQR